MLQRGNRGTLREIAIAVSPPLQNLAVLDCLILDFWVLLRFRRGLLNIYSYSSNSEAIQKCGNPWRHREKLLLILVSESLVKALLVSRVASYYSWVSSGILRSYWFSTYFIKKCFWRPNKWITKEYTIQQKMIATHIMGSLSFGKLLN